MVMLDPATVAGGGAPAAPGEFVEDDPRDVALFKMESRLRASEGAPDGAAAAHNGGKFGDVGSDEVPDGELAEEGEEGSSWYSDEEEEEEDEVVSVGASDEGVQFDNGDEDEYEDSSDEEGWEERVAWDGGEVPPPAGEEGDGGRGADKEEPDPPLEPWAPSAPLRAGAVPIPPAQLGLLAEALEKDDAKLVDRALEGAPHLAARQAVLRAATAGGLTALHVAATKGSTGVLAGLLASGADPGAVDADGRTALWYACAGGREGAALALVEAGPAAATQTDRRGRGPIHAAAAGGHLALIDLVVAHGAGLRPPLEEDLFDEPTAGSGAPAEPPLMAAARAGQAAAAEHLLALGSVLDDVDSEGRGPLHAAARAGQVGMVEWLMRKGLKDAAATGGARRTALLEAVRAGRTACARELLWRGADLRSRDARGRTALHTATKHGHVDLVEYLAAHRGGHLVKIQDGAGWTALDMCHLRAIHALPARALRPCLHAAIKGTPWRPYRHHLYPPMLRAATRQLLLTVAVAANRNAARADALAHGEAQEPKQGPLGDWEPTGMWSIDLECLHDVLVHAAARPGGWGGWPGPRELSGDRYQRYRLRPAPDRPAGAGDTVEVVLFADGTARLSGETREAPLPKGARRPASARRGAYAAPEAKPPHEYDDLLEAIHDIIEGEAQRPPGSHRALECCWRIDEDSGGMRLYARSVEGPTGLEWALRARRSAAGGFELSAEVGGRRVEFVSF